MGRKLFWNFILKNYIMIVTDMYAFVYAWVIALEYQFLCEKKMRKISHFV